MVTADHGCDPSYTKTTDHTREHVPFLVYGSEIKPGVNLHTPATALPPSPIPSARHWMLTTAQTAAACTMRSASKMGILLLWILAAALVAYSLMLVF